MIAYGLGGGREFEADTPVAHAAHAAVLPPQVLLRVLLPRLSDGGWRLPCDVPNSLLRALASAIFRCCLVAACIARFPLARSSIGSNSATWLVVFFWRFEFSLLLRSRRG